jgi:hypothetical protein
LRASSPVVISEIVGILPETLLRLILIVDATLNSYKGKRVKHLSLVCVYQINMFRRQLQLQLFLQCNQ